MAVLLRNGEEYEYDYEPFEDVVEDPYFYEIYFSLDDETHSIVVTGFGVSVLWADGSSTHTNIIPNRLFPGKIKLSDDDLIKIIDIVENTDCEGRKIPKEDMEASFKEWEDLGKPDV